MGFHTNLSFVPECNLKCFNISYSNRILNNHYYEVITHKTRTITVCNFTDSPTVECISTVILIWYSTWNILLIVVTCVARKCSCYKGMLNIII